ncbi:hypothetical protein C0995_001775 [Termitomyces sp. Mi166|nr:hypothetical protein C0995_001775 [Termitomyces sp. Mi166\
MSEESVYAWSNLNFDRDSDASTLPNLNNLNSLDYVSQKPSYSSGSSGGGLGGLSYDGQETHGIVSDVRNEERVDCETTFFPESPEGAISDFNWFLDQVSFGPEVTADHAGSFPIQNDPSVSSGFQYYPEGFLQVPSPTTSGNAALARSQNEMTHYPESFKQVASDYNLYFNQAASRPAVPAPLVEYFSNQSRPPVCEYYLQSLLQASLPPRNDALAWSRNKITHYQLEPVTSDNTWSLGQGTRLPAVPTHPAESFPIQNEPLVPSDSQYCPEGFLQVRLPPTTSGNAALALSQNEINHYPESFEQAASDYHWDFNQAASLPAVPAPPAESFPIQNEPPAPSDSQFYPQGLQPPSLPPSASATGVFSAPPSVNPSNTIDLNLQTNTTPSKPITTSDSGVLRSDAFHCFYGKCRMQIRRKAFLNDHDYQTKMALSMAGMRQRLS